VLVATDVVEVAIVIMPSDESEPSSFTELGWQNPVHGTPSYNETLILFGPVASGPTASPPIRTELGTTKLYEVDVAGIVAIGAPPSSNQITTCEVLASSPSVLKVTVVVAPMTRVSPPFGEMRVIGDDVATGAGATSLFFDMVHQIAAITRTATIITSGAIEPLVYVFFIFF
jgi:hypothetical protein